MTYYVKTGVLRAKVVADSPQEAARLAGAMWQFESDDKFGAIAQVSIHGFNSEAGDDLLIHAKFVRELREHGKS